MSKLFVIYKQVKNLLYYDQSASRSGMCAEGQKLEYIENALTGVFLWQFFHSELGYCSRR